MSAARRAGFACRMCVPGLAVLMAFGCGAPSGTGKGGSAGSPDEPDHERAHDVADAAPGTIRLDLDTLPDLRLTTAGATMRPAVEGITVPGEIGVNEEAYAEVGSPIAARVTRLTAAAGDDVSAGQQLARMDSVELGRARADVITARARADLAARTLERTRGLAEDRIAPQRALQEAQAEARSAQAGVDAAEAALHAMALPVDGGSSFTLRAPLAGRVIERTAVQGRMVEPSTALFRIADLSRVWLTAHASEADALRIHPGTAARVTLTAQPDRKLPASVTRVGSRVDPDSRTIPVRLELDNPEGILRPGLSASAWIPVDESAGDVLVVPAAAVQRVAGRWAVFTPGEPGIFHVKPVQRGREFGSDVEIVSGLASGDVVVVEGAFLLKAEAESSGGEADHHDH